MADLETVHDTFDHTGLTGVGGGGGGEFTEVDIVNKTDAAFTTTSNTFVDVTGLSITQTTAAVRCLITFSGVINCATANVIVGVDLDVDGSRVGGTLGLTHMRMQSANDRVPISFTYVTNVLSAASHTFKIQMRSDGTATVAMQAEASTSPARFTVLETSMTT